MSRIDMGELGLIDLDDLTDYERELYEERSAIMEFDGGLARPDAEREALAEVMRRRRAIGNYPKPLDEMSIEQADSRVKLVMKTSHGGISKLIDENHELLEWLQRESSIFPEQDSCVDGRLTPVLHPPLDEQD